MTYRPPLPPQGGGGQKVSGKQTLPAGGPPTTGGPLRYTEPAYRPPYLPGQEPLPSRSRQRRSSPILAPILALVGLLVVGGASVWAVSMLGTDLTGFLTQGASPSPDVVAAGSSPEPRATSEPTLAIVDVEPSVAPDIAKPPPDERADIAGTIVFSRAGDIWAASGRELNRLTSTDSTKSDSSPAWSPDGKEIYFIRTTRKATENTLAGGLYTFYVPDVYRMKADGSDRKRIHDSLIQSSGKLWFSHVLQPDVSPDGKTVAVVSDGPDGTGPVELFMLDAKSGNLKKVAAPAQGEQGHSDPAFSPDGKQLAFTYNQAQGEDGVPRIGILKCRSRGDCTGGKVKLLRPGYAHPAWSPDGSWLAVEATRGTGRDIAIIDPRAGDIRLTLTDDGNSFAPVVSPNGDQIAYLHRDGQDIDVRVMTLEIGADGGITLVSDQAVTQDGNIDGTSPPNWFIPERQLTGSDGAANPDAGAAGAGAATLEPSPSLAEGAPPPP